MQPVDQPIRMNRPMVPRPPPAPQRTTQGLDWPELPNVYDGWPGIELVAGIEYCFALGSSAIKARRAEGWLQIPGCESILVQGIDVVLLGKGKRILGASVHDCPPSFHIENALAEELGIVDPEELAAQIAAEAQREADAQAAEARRPRRQAEPAPAPKPAPSIDEMLGEAPGGKGKRPA